MEHTEPTGESIGQVTHVLSGEPYDRYVGRQNGRYRLKRDLLHNPYKVATDLPLEDVLKFFNSHMHLQCYLNPEYREAVKSCAGKTLACWCAPKNGHLTTDDPVICHAQIILKYAERLTESDRVYKELTERA